jgi:hypothetical protein
MPNAKLEIWPLAARTTFMTPQIAERVSIVKKLSANVEFGVNDEAIIVNVMIVSNKNHSNGVKNFRNFFIMDNYFTLQI